MSALQFALVFGIGSIFLPERYPCSFSYFQLELEQCFQAAQGLGDPNIEVGNEYNMPPSQANHAQQEPSIPMA